MTAIDDLNAGKPGRPAQTIFRKGNNFSDQAIAGGVSYSPVPATNSLVPKKSGIGELPQAISSSRPGTAAGPVSRAAAMSTGGINDLTRAPSPVSPRALSEGLSPRTSNATGIGDLSQAPAPIYRKGNDFSDQPIAGGVPYLLGSSDAGKPGGGGLSVITPASDIQDQYRRAGAAYRDIADLNNGRDPASLEAKARQKLAFADASASEGRIAQQNALRSTARGARIDANSLLTTSPKTKRMLLERSLSLSEKADDIAGLPPNMDFVLTPEQEAGLANTKRQGRIDQQDADTRSVLAGAEAARASRGPQETFGNPVDELDVSGRPVRAQYGSQGSRRPVNDAQPMPKAGAGLSVGPDGTLQVLPGNSAPKLTEQQSKDLNYYYRGTKALQNLGDGNALTSYISKAGGSMPVIGNSLTGDAYQQQEQAGREFLASVLRKDTGAAITDKELAVYSKTYLPQPGDSKQTLQQKARSRQTALEAIRSGMGPAQMLVPEDGPSSQQGYPGDVAAAEGEQMLEEQRMAAMARRKQQQRMVADGFTAMIEESNAKSQQRDYSDLWK